MDYAAEDKAILGKLVSRAPLHEDEPGHHCAASWQWFAVAIGTAVTCGRCGLRVQTKSTRKGKF